MAPQTPGLDVPARISPRPPARGPLAWRRCGAAYAAIFLAAWAAPTASAAEYAGWAVGAAWDQYGTVLRSSDSGNTWIRQGAGQIADVSLSSVSAIDPDTAWAVGGASDGYATIYHTTDGGSTWTRMGSSADVPNTTLTKVYARDDQDVWAVGSGAILHTTDGGATWTNCLPTGYGGAVLQGVHALDSQTVWVTGGPVGGYATVLRTDDAGQNWVRQSGGDVPSANHLLGVSALDATTAWAVGGTGDGYIALSTTDGGDTWIWQKDATGLWDINEVVLTDDGMVWMACDMGIFYSDDDGASWQSHVTGEYCLGMSAVSSQQAWASRGGGETGALYATFDGGGTWIATFQLDGQNLPSLPGISFAAEPVPEPSTLAACLACLAVGRSRRKRRAHGTA